jgi:hypothetical protein
MWNLDDDEKCTYLTEKVNYLSVLFNNIFIMSPNFISWSVSGIKSLYRKNFWSNFSQNFISYKLFI